MPLSKCLATAGFRQNSIFGIPDGGDCIYYLAVMLLFYKPLKKNYGRILVEIPGDGFSKSRNVLII